MHSVENRVHGRSQCCCANDRPFSSGVAIIHCDGLRLLADVLTVRSNVRDAGHVRERRRRMKSRPPIDCTDGSDRVRRCGRASVDGIQVMLARGRICGHTSRAPGAADAGSWSVMSCRHREKRRLSGGRGREGSEVLAARADHGRTVCVSWTLRGCFDRFGAI